MGGTAIDDSDDVFEGAGAGLTLAGVVVASMAVFLVLLPIAIGIVEPAVDLSWIGGVAGGLAASLGVVKLVAMAWGAGSRLAAEHPASVSAALAD